MGKALFKRQPRGEVKGRAVSTETPGQEAKAIPNAPVQWQVPHVFVEQVVQPEDEDFRRLPPPPMPKEESNFWTSAAPHFGQTASLSRPMPTRLSKTWPHLGHMNS
jgi:hypothetical protein